MRSVGSALACADVAGPRAPTSSLTFAPSGNAWPSVPKMAPRSGTLRVILMWSPAFNAGLMLAGDQSMSARSPTA